MQQKFARFRSVFCFVLGSKVKKTFFFFFFFFHLRAMLALSGHISHADSHSNADGGCPGWRPGGFPTACCRGGLNAFITAANCFAAVLRLSQLQVSAPATLYASSTCFLRLSKIRAPCGIRTSPITESPRR